MNIYMYANSTARQKSVVADVIKGKGKGRVLAIALLTRTRDQKHFTISEVAADWHQLMIPQRIMWPSIGPAVQHTDIPPPQLATLGLHHIARKLLLISRPAKGRRLS